jgi:hypothetical protein
MCSCSDNVGVLEWAGDDASSNETRDMSHINDKVCTNEIRDLAHTTVVDQAAVGRGSSNKDLRSVHQSILLQSVIIDDASFEVDTVWEGFEVGGNGRNPTL